MAARLGNVFYWTFSILAVLWLGFCVWWLIAPGAKVSASTIAITVGGAVALWAVGRAVRQVLAGR